MAGKYIRKGGLRLQCLAEVFLTYARSQNELVIGERLSGPGPQNGELMLFEKNIINRQEFVKNSRLYASS